MALIAFYINWVKTAAKYNIKTMGGSSVFMYYGWHIWDSARLAPVKWQTVVFGAPVNCVHVKIQWDVSGNSLITARMYICAVFLGTPAHLACWSTPLVHHIIERNWFFFFIISQYIYVTDRWIPVRIRVKYY